MVSAGTSMGTRLTTPLRCWSSAWATRCQRKSCSSAEQTAPMRVMLDGHPLIGLRSSFLSPLGAGASARSLIIPAVPHCRRGKGRQRSRKVSEWHAEAFSPSHTAPLARMSNQELSGDPSPQYFLKSTAIEMGGVLQYKWVVFCWVSISSSRLRSQGGKAIHKWGAYCCTNWRCTVYCRTFFKTSRGWGFSNSSDQRPSTASHYLCKKDCSTPPIRIAVFPLNVGP